MKIYIVVNGQGMDGDTIITVFSKKEDAEKLCSLYNESDNYGDYDYYYISEEEVDERKIENYYLNSQVDDDYSYKSLEYKED